MSSLPVIIINVISLNGYAFVESNQFISARCVSRSNCVIRGRCWLRTNFCSSPTRVFFFVVRTKHFFYAVGGRSLDLISRRVKSLEAHIFQQIKLTHPQSSQAKYNKT